MKKLLAILLCLALVVGCFAGCGQSAGSGTTFRKMYSGEVTTMNYLVTGSTNDLIIPANVIDTLVEYDAYGAIKPALAESWETSEDGLTWTFHLREGVNGTIIWARKSRLSRRRILSTPPSMHWTPKTPAARNT